MSSARAAPAKLATSATRTKIRMFFKVFMEGDDIAGRR